jgi:hypothetical protein
MADWDGQTERFYLLRVPPFAIRPGVSADALRAEGVPDLRWWTIDELDAARDVVLAPSRLASHLGALLEHGPPPAPIDVGE